jgi:exopolysaccharide biosynthesis polyprenyl glycosylphosphotransferase
MLGRDRQLRTQVFQLKDAFMFMLALGVAHYLRSSFRLETLVGWLPWIGHGLEKMLSVEIEPFAQFAWLFLLILPGGPLVLESQGFYNRPIFCSRYTTAWILLKSCTVVVLGVILVMFPFKATLSRAVIILFGPISFSLLFLSEELMRLGFKSRFGQSQLKKRMLLIGSPEDNQRIRADLSHQKANTLEIVGELDINENSLQDLVKQLHKLSPSGVILNAKHTFFGRVEKAIQVCEREGVESWLVADFFQTQISRTSFDDFYGRPVMVFRSAPENSWQGVLKQVMDVIGALVLILVFSPVFLGAMLAIRFTSPGAILFKQERCGLNGRPFTMLKFRSMVSDAEQRKQELAELNEMSGPVFKVSNDPRITPVGRMLRKYSVDEFPQLFNVLRGEMSLVGPRPLPVDEVERFDDPAHRRRLSVKPGLTCLWQVSGRNNLRDFDEWVRLDLHYIDNWSIWLDLKILWRTIPVVLTGAGAR